MSLFSAMDVPGDPSKLLLEDIPGVDHADLIGPVPETLDELGLPVEQSPNFDDSVKLAAQLTGSPMAAVTLLDADYQWFKAKVGIPLRGTRRDVSFCRYTVECEDGFIVPDATLDSRFRANPLVTEAHNVRAYAGARLVMPDGRCVGAICVLDTKPRSFGKGELQVLQLLAHQVVSQLQLEQVVHRQAQDIDDLRIARSEMRHMAMHDDLTGLLNRRGVIAALEQMSCNHPSMSRAWATGVSALYLDLDAFKRINDNRGHEFGDRVLIEVACRLEAVAGPGRLLGRLGGDEFIVVTIGATEAESATLAEKILRSVQQPMKIDDIATVIETSIGIATATDITCALELIDHADRAMYHSKQAGGSSVSAWSEELVGLMDTEVREANKFVRSCLDNDRIRVHFQPMFDLTAGHLVRREALLRWTGEAPDSITVEDFILAAERTGLIQRVGALVLDEACRIAAAWQETEPGVGVAVNVSPLQVIPGLVEVVASALDRSGLPPELLTLELTESTVLERVDEAFVALEEVHALGVRLALDDFGTGYASMSMLVALPLDEVKIDREICADPNGSAVKVVRATIDLGHSLGLSVVAEGIESDVMLAKLSASGCDVGQGYFLGRPVELL